MAYMLSYANAHRNRGYLRINEDEKAFRVWHPTNRDWHHTTNGVMSSNTATDCFSCDGQRVDIHSHVGFRQIIFLANTMTFQTVGRLEISDYGAIMLNDGPIFDVNVIPEYWQHKTLLILGLPGACTINIRDTLGNDVDIIRLKQGHPKMFVPHRYNRETDQYDVTFPQRFNFVNDQPNDDEPSEEPKIEPTESDSVGEAAGGIGGRYCSTEYGDETMASGETTTTTKCEI